MFSSIILFLGMFILCVSIKIFLKEMKLYKNGIIKTAKIIQLEAYSYITYGQERSKFYHVGINPILEFEVGDEKLKIDYGSYEDMCDLSEGDEVQVIYPKGNIGAVTRYSKYKLFKKSVIWGIISLFFLFLGMYLILL